MTECLTSQTTREEAWDGVSKRLSGTSSFSSVTFSLISQVLFISSCLRLVLLASVGFGSSSLLTLTGSAWSFCSCLLHLWEVRMSKHFKDG